MKRIVALMIAAAMIAAVCCGCAIGRKRISKDPVNIAVPTNTIETQADPPTVNVEPEKKQTPTQKPVGQLSDYVRTAKEVELTNRTLRLPEILIDSDDAKSANETIMGKFGEYIDDPERHNYVGALDYEAYLNDVILSVLITVKYDGGNTYGQCYSFDVNTGVKLSNTALCKLAGRDYDTAKSALKTNLTTYYDEKYSDLPDNEKMRSQTLDDSNINAAIMYLDGSGRLKAMIEIFAAVGGGHWVTTIPAE